MAAGVRLRRWQTLVSLLAFICALGGASHFTWHGYATAAAIGLISIVAASLLVANLAKQAQKR